MKAVTKYETFVLKLHSGEAQAKAAARERERRVFTDLLLVLVRHFIVAHRWLLSLLLLNHMTKWTRLLHSSILFLVLYNRKTSGLPCLLLYCRSPYSSVTSKALEAS